MNDTIILKLHGTVPLPLFSKAVAQFNALVDALSSEVAGIERAELDEPRVAEIRWDIARLIANSAHVEVRGLSDDLDLVERAVRAYSAVGESLHNREPIPFSEHVQKPAYKLTSFLNGFITSLSLATPFGEEQTVNEPLTAAKAESASNWSTSWGTVRGELGAISLRPKLRITLYDSLFDKAVACILRKDQKDWESRIWDLRGDLEVTGLIHRRYEDDRPMRVTNILDIKSLGAPGDFRRARGVIPWTPGDELPEVAIRRMRDGWSS